MTYRKLLAGASSVTLAAIVVFVVAQKQAAGATPVAEPVPLWAFPGPRNEQIPASQQAFSAVQMFDRTRAVDWFPDEHPTMPPIVMGRQAVYACGFCHLPQGAGRPENAALAGMPAAYLKQQMVDMKSGARTVAHPSFGPGQNMLTTIKQVSEADMDEAAKYYASLKYIKRVKIVEASETPKVTQDAFVYVFDKTGAKEPLGERIVEGPDDFELLEMRDPRLTMTAYVSPGSIARGAVVAKGTNPALACETCHGSGLKGGALGPPIAGRPLTATFRQLYAFKAGTRNGPTSQLMKAVVAGLTQKQMMDVTAYVGSLEP